MAKKQETRRYESDVMALPPLKMVLGDVPVPDPRRGRNKDIQKPVENKEEIVQKLINRLLDK
jgi:hypothetical protein